MTDHNRVNQGSRNRQLRLTAEFWFMIIPVAAVFVALLLPLVQVLRAFFRGF